VLPDHHKVLVTTCGHCVRVACWIEFVTKTDTLAAIDAVSLAMEAIDDGAV
jgi:hypothetical protein